MSTIYLLCNGRIERKQSEFLSGQPNAPVIFMSHFCQIMSLQLADGHNAKQNHFNVRLISVSYGASEPAGMAFTKSLASVSERSRDITLTALVP